jgi:hypothetical protein
MHAWRLGVAFFVTTVACAGRKELPPGAGYDHVDEHGRASAKTTYGQGADDDDNDPTAGAGSQGDGGTNGSASNPNGTGGGANGAPSGNPNGAPQKGDPPRVCTDLSTCCAKPKACPSEVFACQAVAEKRDENLCAKVLQFYDTVGCSNMLNLGPQILAGFPGCFP